jgi:hypothetical protein
MTAGLACSVDWTTDEESASKGGTEDEAPMVAHPLVTALAEIRVWWAGPADTIVLVALMSLVK